MFSAAGKIGIKQVTDRGGSVVARLDFCLQGSARGVKCAKARGVLAC